MAGPLRMTVRFFVIAATVAAMAMIFVPSSRSNSPYLSALSESFATTALARGGCEFKDCAGGSRHNIVCAKVLTPSICTTYHGTCVAAGCP